MKEKILLLYLKTGGGHLSAARALADKISHLYPNKAEAILIDGIPPERTLLRHILIDGYHLMSGRLKPLWAVLFVLLRNPLLMDIALRGMSRLVAPYLADTIRKTGAGRIVVLHYLLTRAVSDALDLMDRNLPTATAVLDPISVHPIWLRETRFPVILFSEEARRFAVEEYGFPERLISVHPMILNERFAAPLSKEERDRFRRELGFLPDKPLVLIAGGGEGLPRGERIFRSFLDKRPDLQVVIVCGKSRKLKTECEEMLRRRPGRTARVFGFVDFMYEIMNAADLIITKGGPATIMEALLLRKPIIISDYMFGQESGNVDFVLRHGVGIHARRGINIVREVEEILCNPARHGEMLRRIEDLHLSLGTASVVEEVMSLYEEGIS